MAETGIAPSDPTAGIGVVDELDQLDRTELAISFERVFTLVRRLTPQGDLSLTAVSTLRTLERQGPHRLSELAAREGVTQPAMTQLVSRLERDGLAQRCADPGDGRVVVVRIADAGRELLLARREARAQKLYELLSSLPPADRAAIVAALPALNRLADLTP
jgi:DNA-binding MarR family transcriptional regulator